MKRIDHVLSLVRRQPWAILPDSLEWASILDVISLRARGEELSDADRDARIELVRSQRGERRGASTSGAVGVVPLYGPIVPRADLMSKMSGATSVQSFTRSLRAAAADPDVSTILLDVDSPGGMVDMIPEAAAEVRKARAEKPVVAVADTVMASAAYWIASQADEVVASPSAKVGSIGVLTVHEDWSGAYEQAGIRPTLLTAGKHKAEGNEYGPLSDEDRAAMQERIDRYYSMFVEDVAKGRKVPVASVRDGYGEGRVLIAKDALKAGLIDRVGTLDETIARVATSPPRPRDARAEAPVVEGNEWIEPTTADAPGVADRFEFERELYERRAAAR